MKHVYVFLYFKIGSPRFDQNSDNLVNCCNTLTVFGQILTLAICFPFSTSFLDTCYLPLGKWGTTSFTPWMAKFSSIVNLLSAKTTFSASSLFRNPIVQVILLFDALPPQHLDKKDAIPFGKQPIKI